MIDPIKQFEEERATRLQNYGKDEEFATMSREWVRASMERQYVYNFDWLGRPIIQYPQDMVAMQDLIWRVRPDLVIETGIAHGGSLVLSASMLALLDYCDAVQEGRTLDPKKSRRCVLGLDIDIRAHNAAAIASHPLSHLIKTIQGSSVSPEVIQKVKEMSGQYSKVLVCLDSNHTHQHVLEELEAYAPLVSRGSYVVVFDTFVEDMPPRFFADRPWDVGNNPKTAVREYLSKISAEGRVAADGQALHLAIDEDMERRLAITVAPAGFLVRS